MFAGTTSFVTFGNVPPITPEPAPKIWYWANQSFERAPGSDHCSERTCSSAARMPASLLMFADPSCLKKYMFGSAEQTKRFAEDPKNAGILQEALYEVTGRKLALSFELGEGPHDEPSESEPHIASEEDFVSLIKDTFDAREVED